MVTGDYKIQSFVTLQRRGDHQRSFGAETPLITYTRAPPCHDPPISSLLITQSHTHTNTYTHHPPPPVPPSYKVDPYSPPLPKHALLCQQALVSCKQRNQKCEGFRRHGWGLLIPSYWLFLYLFSQSFLCPQRNKRKNCNFLSCSLACLLAFPTLLSSLLLSLSFFYCFVRAPTRA